jgi:iron(III) transport system ATP-binding protein
MNKPLHHKRYNKQQNQTSLLQVTDVSIAYGKHTVVHNISLQLSQGEIGCLLGPSGCGKTTLLRAIAGFEGIISGEISLAKKTVSTPTLQLAPEKRNIGMVFQDFALFPHLNIADNIRFGIRHLSTKAQQQRITELLSLINLEGFETRYPHQLSGGQQQRIALARSLAPKPHLLLMDEPFSSMDIELREELAREVRHIIKHENITAILVTHDQQEAFTMADTIGVIEQGNLVQWDTGYNLYHRPTTPFVADFIGQGVLIKGVVINQNTVETTLALLKGVIPKGCQIGCPVQILVRPDDILHDDNSPQTACIIGRDFLGANYMYTLELEDGTQFQSLVHSHHQHAVGDKLGITLDVNHLVVFPSKD